jgi:hypothetical protein
MLKAKQVRLRIQVNIIDASTKRSAGLVAYKVERKFL